MTREDLEKCIGVPIARELYEKLKSIYDMGYADGQRALAEHIELCKEEQEPILDKIRAEIEQTAKDYDKFDDYRRVRGLWIALDIIDKYRQENKDEV